ncbi:hypothetical protein B0T14DRAFT_436647 [Immersiella caudata]|uniref:CNH domain-containing protein n=1 Tax=Immersiella caudata TaxID=314043 RepID=A0AA39WEG0_9PEZI|nr:hypothetical protein B0T14DRAFT_436647 [Immersiella caudata]
MLSAFTARPIIELRQRDKSKIESILAYSDRVLVGLNTGALRIYRLNELPAFSTPTNNPPNGDSSLSPSQADAATTTASEPPSDTHAPAEPQIKPTDLLREVERFSPRAVEQLAIIKEASTLVSLSNYAISLHDLNTFEPIEAPLARTRNASVFAVTSNVLKDPMTGIPEIISRLAVAVKRRLLLWSWHESELSQDVTEVVLAEAIRTVTWANATKVVCGMNSGYVMVDVETGTVEDIVGHGVVGGVAGGQAKFGAVSAAGMGYMVLGGSTPKPLATKLGEGELLLAKDINTLFIDDQGKALDKRQVPWQSAPDGIGYSYPYMLALQHPTKGSLEVRNPETLNLLQTINLPAAAALHFTPPTSSLAHAGKGFYVLSERVVWKMDATNYDSQIEELIGSGKYDEAISVLGMLEDALLKNKTQTMREVKMLKAELLFRQKKYRESMDLFNEDEVHAPPERVLKLFPRIIAGDLAGVEEEKDSSDSDHEEHNGKTNGETGQKADTAALEPQVASPPRASAGGFTKYLMGHRKLNPETASIASSKRASDTDDNASIKGVKANDEQSKEEKDLMAAVQELSGYLVGARTRLQRVLDPATGKLRPRKTQSGSTEEAFKTLMSSSREESDDQLEEELQSTFKILDTALFRTYMYSRSTLTSFLFRIPNFCDPDVVNERLKEHNRFTELVDFFYGKKLHKQALELLRRFGSPDEPDEAAPTLHGPQRTVAYLQGLPPDMIDVILEFSDWALRKDPKLAMEVFLADSENAETLPRKRVDEFLRGIDPALEIEYLEHIIMELKDMTPGFHDRLVELLIARLIDTEQGKGWDDLMERLLRFLGQTWQGSQQYGLLTAFNLIPKTDPRFYEAQAVVLSNMGNHKQALEIYVFKMKDYAKAEEYCNRIHRTEDSHTASPSQTTPGGTEDPEDARPSIYHTLLSLYLTPPPSQERNLGPALNLLSKHGCRLPASSTLSLVPDSLPVAELESYFRGRMRSANSVVNETRIVAKLHKTGLVASEALRLLGDGAPGGQGGRNRSVLVSEERVCGVCHKRLGGSVVAILPDNAVVHLGCLNRPKAGETSSSYKSVGAWGRSGGIKS